MPVDSYGVGSWLIRGDNDFTADIVLTDGLPSAKVGRRSRSERAARARRFSSSARPIGLVEVTLGLLRLRSRTCSSPGCPWSSSACSSTSSGGWWGSCRGSSRPRSSPTRSRPSAGTTSPASTRPPPSSRRSSTSSSTRRRFSRPRRPRSEGDPPLRAPRDRQDAARQGRRPRLGRDLLLPERVRLRRDVRRPRRGPHPQALRQGAQERARDRLHRRARRGRDAADAARASTASTTRR